MPPRMSKKEKKAALAAAAAAGGGEQPEVEDEGGETPSSSTPRAGAGGPSGGDSATVDPETSSTMGAQSTASGGHGRAGHMKVAAASRTATGILTSEKRSRDIKIAAFSVNLYGRVLVEDTGLEFSWGNRYGLIGANGSGKSTILQVLAAREVPLPDHMDVYLLDGEAEPSELTALEYVIVSAKEEAARLEALSETILAEEGPDSDALMDIYDRQSELDPATFESRASSILIGLGFNAKTLHKQTKDMSGGWRMRVALARALFVAPSILLLDEPTNHLDLAACVWLEDHLSTYSKILVVISHSQEFLDGVTTHTMVLQRQRLKTWGGNYSQYVTTRAEQDVNQLKAYEKQQAEIVHIKQFIASCGTYANLVRQAQSRQKVLDKMIADGLIEKPYSDPVFRFKFPETSPMPPPLVSFSDVAFSYSGKKEDWLYSGLRFGIDSDSRIALVGPNGAGKSTLIKLITGDIHPCTGSVTLRSGISIGRYHQHSADVLDLAATPLEYIARKYAERFPKRTTEEWRSALGQYGVPSEYHVLPISVLSEGLRLRLVFAEIALLSPHILLLDEPTNAADMEMITSLAEAINAFKGGVVLVSHDFRLLSMVAREIWVVEGGVKRWEGDIRSYKNQLRKDMEKAARAAASSARK